uniref:Uncharacterized protein n=1 Tax=Fagus sylvatica TaxID=28930 RepID=A0A2N9GKF9_FAGSY
MVVKSFSIFLTHASTSKGSVVPLNTGRPLAGPVAALQLGPAAQKLELVAQPFMLVAQIHKPVALPLVST